MTMRVLINNLAPEATDEELKALLVKYGFPPFDEIQRFGGEGSRPTVLVTFHSAFSEQLEPLVARVQGIYWKGHALEIELVPILS